MENKQLKIELEQLQQQYKQLEQQFTKLQKENEELREDYGTMARIINRARQMEISEDEFKPPIFKMDRNGNLEKSKRLPSKKLSHRTAFYFGNIVSFRSIIR